MHRKPVAAAVLLAAVLGALVAGASVASADPAHPGASQGTSSPQGNRGWEIPRPISEHR